MNYIKIVLFLCVLLFLFGCSESSNLDAGKSGSFISQNEEKQRSKSNYLAYEHFISVTTEKNHLHDAFKQLIDKCIEDEKYNCIVLQSSHSGGDYASAEIRLRLTPEGVPNYIGFVAKAGEVDSQSTLAEDLTEVLSDNEKHLEMLESYRMKLEQLVENPKNNIDSLIKISSEIAKVQTEIEYAKGKKSKLHQRIKMDILNISLVTSKYESFWRTISFAVSKFAEDFSEGIAIVITSAAYFIPWSVVLLLVIYAIRVIWRRTKARRIS